MNNKSRLIYPEFLRIYSTFLVILLHISGNMWVRLDITSLNWRVINIYNTFPRSAVPIFIMISGIFLLSPKKEISIYKLYKKYILRIFITLAFWSVFYIFLNYFDAYDFKTIIKFLLEGKTNYHLWYLYMLIGLYILTPPIRIFIKNSNRKDIEYLLGILLIFSFIIKFLPDISVFSYLKVFTSKMRVFNLTPYIFYYILGYYLANYDFPKIINKLIYILGLIALVFSIYQTRVLTLNSLKPMDYWQMPDNFNIALYTGAVFIFTKNVFNTIKLTNFSKKVIHLLASYSFGIFLTHDIFIKICNRLNLFDNLANPILLVPILTLLDFILCFILTYIIKKTFKYHNYII
ncbi:MAG: acyltransferase family protein [Clostridiales bacterium]|nr:acyltransferase family protein [Clostridiales bacterium]